MEQLNQHEFLKIAKKFSYIGLTATLINNYDNNSPFIFICNTLKNDMIGCLLNWCQQKTSNNYSSIFIWFFNRYIDAKSNNQFPFQTVAILSFQHCHYFFCIIDIWELESLSLNERALFSYIELTGSVAEALRNRQVIFSLCRLTFKQTSIDWYLS